MSPEQEAAERHERIAQAVVAYLAAQSGEPIPGEEDAEIPEPYEHLLRCERWRALPRAGGLYEQPYHFMGDLEAAMLGRVRWEEMKRINRERQAQWTAEHGESEIQPA
jgi:hypothetical protein